MAAICLQAGAKGCEILRDRGIPSMITAAIWRATPAAEALSNVSPT